MRVLHVAAYYAPAYGYGGPPRSIHGLCRALTRRGIDVEVFTTDADGAGQLPASVTAAGQFEGVRVRYFPRSWPAWPIGSHDLIAALRLALTRVDLVHVHGLWNRVVWASTREAARAGVPLLISTRGMLEDAAVAHRSIRKRVSYAAFDRHALDRATLLHATSPREQETLRLMRPSTPIALIPNGVDAPARTAPLPAGPPVFAFVGRIHPIKRVDLLLDAFALVRQRCAAARLVIAGPDEQGLQAGLEHRHSLGDAVTWLGAVTAAQRDAALASARALVLCSDSESFGMAVVEAMAAARPVVVTRSCGWEDLETHGAGLLVDQTPEAIAEAMVRLADDHGAAAAMGERGRAWVDQAFTWPAIADAFATAYAGVARPAIALSR